MAQTLPVPVLLHDESLTPKETTFVKEWVKDKHGTNAYLRSFGTKNRKSAGVLASRLLADVRIQTAIRKELDQIEELARITPARILQEYSRIAFGDHRTIYDENGNLRPIADMDDAAAALISGIEVEEIREFNPSTEQMEVVGHTKKVRRWDKQRALDKLAEHTELFKSATNNIPITVNLNFGNQQINVKKK